MDPHVIYAVKTLNHSFVLGAMYYPENRVCCKTYLVSVFCATLRSNIGIICNFLSGVAYHGIA